MAYVSYLEKDYVLDTRGRCHKEWNIRGCDRLDPLHNEQFVHRAETDIFPVTMSPTLEKKTYSRFLRSRDESLHSAKTASKPSVMASRSDFMHGGSRLSLQSLSTPSHSRTVTDRAPARAGLCSRHVGSDGESRESSVTTESSEPPRMESRPGVITTAESGIWVGRGYLTGIEALLTADRGYLIWNKPEGQVLVTFMYGKTGYDFSCFFDPQFRGVRVSRLKPNGKQETVLDGYEDPQKSISYRLQNSVCRNRPEHNFHFLSNEGRLQFLLDAVDNDSQFVAPPVFKINFTLAL